MTKRADKFEEDMLKAYDEGVLKSISSTRADLAKFKAAPSATFIKDRRVNIRLPSPGDQPKTQPSGDQHNELKADEARIHANGLTTCTQANR